MGFLGSNATAALLRCTSLLTPACALFFLLSLCPLPACAYEVNSALALAEMQGLDVLLDTYLSSEQDCTLENRWCDAEDARYPDPMGGSSMTENIGRLPGSLS